MNSLEMTKFSGNLVGSVAFTLSFAVKVQVTVGVGLPSGWQVTLNEVPSSSVIKSSGFTLKYAVGRSKNEYDAH